jgi:hypothetical protein
MRGVRHSLFVSPSKEKPQLVVDDTLLAQEEPMVSFPILRYCPCCYPSVFPVLACFSCQLFSPLCKLLQATVNNGAPPNGDKDNEIVTTKNKRCFLLACCYFWKTYCPRNFNLNDLRYQNSEIVSSSWLPCLLTNMHAYVLLRVCYKKCCGLLAFSCWFRVPSHADFSFTCLLH